MRSRCPPSSSNPRCSTPDIVRAIAYADPTGETAVNNVMRGEVHPMKGHVKRTLEVLEALGFTRSDDPFGRRKWSFTHAFSPTSR